MKSPIARLAMAAAVICGLGALAGCRQFAHYCIDDLTTAVRRGKDRGVCDGHCCAEFHAYPDRGDPVCDCSTKCPCHKGQVYR